MSLQQQLGEGLRRMKKFFDTSTSVFKEADSAFAPTPESFTVSQQVAHVAHTIDWFVEGMFLNPEGYDLDFAAIEDEIRKVTSLAEARAWLDKSVERAVKVLAEASDELLDTGMANDPILDGLPRKSIVWALEDHTAHHRGALTVYARLLGKASPMPYA